MQKISLEELSHYSPWPARLRTATISKGRSEVEVYREYNDDKYGPIADAQSLEEAFRGYFGEDTLIPFSRHNEIFLEKKYAAYALNNRYIIDSLRPILDKVEWVVELGAGFGQTLSHIQKEYPHLKYRGGEFSKNALAIGRRVLPQVEFQHFNFYDPEWKIFDGVSNALVITVHALEMLQDASIVVRQLQKHSGLITRAVHFEPIYEDDSTELGRMRQRYIEYNGYCKNILQSIPNPIIERDLFGFNPLFCESRLEWNPAAD